MRTRFYPKGPLFVIKIPRDHSLPEKFLRTLRSEGYIHSYCTKSDFGGRVLRVYLAERDNLPVGTLLARLCLRISRFHGYRMVADLVEVGGRPINFKRVIRLLGEVLSSYREIDPAVPVITQPMQVAA
jgi:hypothetical protein